MSSQYVRAVPTVFFKICPPTPISPAVFVLNYFKNKGKRHMIEREERDNYFTWIFGLVVVMTYGTHLSIVILLCRKFICSAEIVVLCSHLLPHLHPHVFFISRYISLLFQNYDLKLCSTINNMLVSLVYEVIHSNTNFQHLSHFSI